MPKELEPTTTYTLECIVHGILGQINGLEVEEKAQEHREEYGCYYEIKVYDPKSTSNQ